METQPLSAYPFRAPEVYSVFCCFFYNKLLFSMFCFLYIWFFFLSLFDFYHDIVSSFNNFVFDYPFCIFCSLSSWSNIFFKLRAAQSINVTKYWIYIYIFIRFTTIRDLRTINEMVYCQLMKQLSDLMVNCQVILS